MMLPGHRLLIPLLASPLLMAGAATAQVAQTATPQIPRDGERDTARGEEPTGARAGTVLFVCEHGSAKSVVAAAHFNRLAAAGGLPFRAISRGTVPDAEMAPAAVRGLLGDGLQPGEPAPAKLVQADLDGVARVVTFCEIPGDLKVRAPVERWEVPPVSTEYVASRDAMLARIEQLLRELTRNQRVPPG